MATTLRTYLLRVLRRPRPWVLRYLLAAVPAAVLSLLFALPLGSWFRLPLFAEALDSRSLGDLLEVLSHPPEGASPGLWLVVALFLIPVVWSVVQLVGLWLEGGILATYAHPATPSWRTFAGTSTRSMGSFLGLALAGFGGTVVVVGGAVALALLGRALWSPLETAVAVVGLVGVVGVGVWIRLARAAVVVREDRNVLRAMREAGRVMLRRPLPLLALVAGALMLRGLLTWGASALVAVVPLRAWLLTLAIQQPVQIVLAGVGLARRAIEVGFLQTEAAAPVTADYDRSAEAVSTRIS